MTTMPFWTQKTISWARAKIRRILGYPFVRNVNGVKAEAGKRRCLMVYLSLPFTRRSNHPSFLTHQNLGQAKMMALALGEAGYVVDVADLRSPRIPNSAGSYDMILTHHPSLALIQNHLTADTTVIYLASCMHPVEHNRLVNARRVALEKRRQCRIPPFEVNDERITVLSRADAITGFGNQSTMGTWSNVFPLPLYCFNNSGFEWIRPAVKVAHDYAYHFLFLGSVDQIRKGLDLLLEVFPKHPDWHLHVAAHYDLEPEFCACYHRELHHTANIHLHGVVVIGSREWDSLIKQCAFVILPSCSEGQAGSVIQAMYAGLIPVVTPTTGIDVEAFGVLLPNDPLPVLTDTLAHLAMMPTAELNRRRKATLMAAHIQYSEVAFQARWNEIVQSMTGIGRPLQKTTPVQTARIQ